MKNLLRIISAVCLAALIIAAGNIASSGNYLNGPVAYAQDGPPDDGSDGPRPPMPTPTLKPPPGPLWEVSPEAYASASVQTNTGGQGLISQMWHWLTNWF